MAIAERSQVLAELVQTLAQLPGGAVADDAAAGLSYSAAADFRGWFGAGEAADALLAAFVVFADAALVVEEVDLGADVVVVVGRDDDGDSGGAHGADEVKAEAFEGVDVDEVGFDRAQPVQDYRGLGRRS